MPGTYLDRILEAHRARAAGDQRDVLELTAIAAGSPVPRPFATALKSPGLSVIAEIKRRSPSRGELAPDLDPVAQAQAYERGGAACISVLTDSEHFGGSMNDLSAVRAGVALPLLRKDFTISANDILDARIGGADAVLLIVAALEDHELQAFIELATQCHLAAVVEVHDGDEVQRALDAGADVIGVNQRDLKTFEVDTQRALDLAEIIPEGTVRIAESGIVDARDARQLAAVGYDAVLVGETLVTADDPAAKVAELRGAA